MVAQPAPVVRLAGLPPGAPIDASLLVREIEHRGGDHPHTILHVGNAAGVLPTAPIWASERYRVEGITRGQVVRLRGSIGRWRDKTQIQLDALEPLPPGAIRWDDLLPSVGDSAPWWRIIDTMRSQIQSPHLRSVLAIFFDDNDFRASFSRCPGSLSGHHGKIGGLLQHTCEVGHFSLTLAEPFFRTDAELLLTAALLHDIGKLDAYQWNTGFEMTPQGRALGHVVLGSQMLERRVAAHHPTPCTSAERELLHHLMLSHHGALDHGAPVLPMTLEAELLHLADLASARGDSMQQALEDSTLFHEDDEISSRSLWQLDHRRVWRRQCDWGRSRKPGSEVSQPEDMVPSGDVYSLRPEGSPSGTAPVR
ncbi:MAG TPA: HD domain-containing protein [Gemmatimonadales bacterium]|nr:HD domain-containing protein [Gemmatimonadales bacterium]